MKNLEGKTAIITGASSGIGWETSLMLANEGANVVIAARREERLTELKEKIGNPDKTLAVTSDVTDKKSVQAMMEQAISRFGSVDILVNNAGVMPLSYMDKVKVDEWEKMIDVNLKGALYVLASVLPHMKANKSGHIINISSVAGRKVFPGGGVYCATKFGVNAISEAILKELATEEKIRVTVIEPGAVATELAQSITDEDVISNFSKSRETMQVMQPKDIAEAIRYALTQPSRVNVSEILVMPEGQNM